MQDSILKQYAFDISINQSIVLIHSSILLQFREIDQIIQRTKTK